ncbi:hypothetical protein HHL22_08660 [Hymenobacter sp. RP-2-7]|uniref:DUF4251 domain-containing protein n=1 Tax=Hymenobacter polaris TaxID=2682546 RepID=A0A7Y0ADB3_9BACT|nr:hypothetical protein [Hymenobacter polaris]NML65273.1 hypothetical protein [Hymenobacter polaris]
MKHFLLTASLLCLALGPAQAQTAPTPPVQAGPISALDAQNGFRTYVLGAPIKEYPQLKRKEGVIYESRKEPLLLGNTQLTNLYFTTYQGRLASIVFGTRGADNSEALVASLTQQYGPSTSANGAAQTWEGNKVTMYVTRVGSGDYEICIVTLKSNELAAEQKATAK